MTTHSLNGKNVLLLKVPECVSPVIDNIFGWLRFRMFVNFKQVPHTSDIELPEGKWRILGQGLASDVTEEEASGIAEGFAPYRWGARRDIPRFKNYSAGIHGPHETAIASLHSFLTLHVYDPKTTIILLNNKL